METAIVTGCAGFIGSHLIDGLLNDGKKVIGIDNFSPYYSRQIKDDNIRKALRHHNFVMINEDMMKVDLIEVCQEADTLFHLAAQSGISKSWGNFKQYVKDNVIVTQKLMDACLTAGNLEHIVIASSSSVYGNREDLMVETDLPKPISPYGVTKLAEENISRAYAELGLPITILRYFTVYGPRQRPDMAFHTFINANLHSEEIEIIGDGSQFRDFTYIEDVLQGTYRAGFLKSRGEIINISGGRMWGIRDIFKFIAEITGKETKIKLGPHVKGDPKITQADITKAQLVLNYHPKWAIREGLEKQIEYQKGLM